MVRSLYGTFGDPKLQIFGVILEYNVKRMNG